MNLLEIKQSVAAYLHKSTEDLTVNSVDLGLQAMNQVRQLAELLHDFEFSRELVTVSVDGLVGGRLESAVIYGTDTPARVKTVLDVGLFNEEGEFVAVDWTTVGDSLRRQRVDNRFRGGSRYPTDGEALRGVAGRGRFTFSNNAVAVFPRGTTEVPIQLGIEAYTFMNDWTEDELLQEDAEIGAPWTTVAAQFLIFATVTQLNQMFKEFVFRQEGNLPPPEKVAEASLQSLIAWDIFKFEQFRRHSR